MRVNMSSHFNVKKSFLCTNIKNLKKELDAIHMKIAEQDKLINELIAVQVCMQAKSSGPNS